MNFGAVFTKNVAQATNGVRTSQSIYGWKAKEISFPKNLISACSDKGIDGNSRLKLTESDTDSCSGNLFGNFGQSSLNSSSRSQTVSEHNKLYMVGKLRR